MPKHPEAGERMLGEGALTLLRWDWPLSWRQPHGADLGALGRREPGLVPRDQGGELPPLRKRGCRRTGGLWRRCLSFTNSDCLSDLHFKGAGAKLFFCI